MTNFIAIEIRVDFIERTINIKWNEQNIEKSS